MLKTHAKSASFQRLFAHRVRAVRQNASVRKSVLKSLLLFAAQMGAITATNASCKWKHANQRIEIPCELDILDCAVRTPYILSSSRFEVTFWNQF